MAPMDRADARVNGQGVCQFERCLVTESRIHPVVSHLEPDHASNIQKVAETYPDMQIVGNAKTFNMMGQFFDIDLTDRKVVVAEGDKLSLGKHELTFVMVPWFMVGYDGVLVNRQGAFWHMVCSLCALILMRTGHVREHVIILILLEVCVLRCRQFSKGSRA